MKWFLYLVFSVCLCETVWGGGAVISFGGSEINRKVHTASQKLVTKMQNVPSFILPEKNIANDIKNLMMTLKIEISTDPLFWEGSEVFAINYPDEVPKRLVISESKWLDLETKTVAVIEPILLHELLPLVGVPDRNYEMSEKIYHVLSNWRPWTSSDYFMKRYFRDSSFLKIWALNAKDYYRSWGVDDGALLDYFAYRWFPTAQEDVGYWLTIFETYLKQVSTNICKLPEFEIQLFQFKSRQQAVYPEIFNLLERWRKRRC